MEIYNARYFVYSHTRTDINVVFYIGLGCYQKKWKYQRAYTIKNRNIHWQRIVHKCKNNFKVSILFDQLDKETAVLKEIELIELYGRTDLGKGTLCNMTNGGEGVWCLSKESRNKISQSMLNNNNAKHNAAWRKLMSKKFSGKGNPNYGKPLPEYQKEINRKTQTGRKKSQEEKDKIYSKTRKKLTNGSLNFDSIKAAKEYYNVSSQTITRWAIKNVHNLKFISNGNLQ